MNGPTTRATIGGVTVDLFDFDDSIAAIMDRAESPRAVPLNVVSINLDHVHHFGSGGRWRGALEGLGAAEYLNLIDGAPIVAQATRVTGRSWPRLSGSDLISPLLDEAERAGLSVGFLGGSPDTQATLRDVLHSTRAGLSVAGWWSPERSVLTNPRASRLLAKEIRNAAPSILVVGLGKPRQELWMARYGAETGAAVLLGFGAVVDFLAGRVRRAPSAVSRRGLEWMWRLALEPSRLSRRYLVDGLPAYLSVRRGTEPLTLATGSEGPAKKREITSPTPTPGQFTLPGSPADVAVLVVTYNNEDDVSSLVASLREETAELRIRLVVADNSPTNATLKKFSVYPDVVAFATGGNLGYAGGINAAAVHAGNCRAILVLNPDLVVGRGSIAALLSRMETSNAAAVVPLLRDNDGSVYPSLRREPTLGRAIGDALFGARFAQRPGWLSEIDTDTESYQHPHLIDWATGAALLIRSDMAARLAGWDERYFLYSEETDYFRRIRDAGGSVWFEPGAAMTHRRGGSGLSAELVALMAVNRVRYAAAHHGMVKVVAVRAVAAAAELARSYQPMHRPAAMSLLGFRGWATLPAAVRPSPRQPATEKFPTGSVIIPAHNESAVIQRALAPLGPLVAQGLIEVIVACNGCTDNTASLAQAFPGVKVLDMAKPSKTEALNAADRVATRWPRVYVDADIELSAATLEVLLAHLATPGALAARPPFRYETQGASAPVRSYYRARARIPELNRHLWGAGIYALSAEGHARFTHFPLVTADDAFVDSIFADEEKTVVASDPVIVRTPRSAPVLLSTLHRVYRGNGELAKRTQRPGRGRKLAGLAALGASVRGPRSALDAIVYTVFAVVARLRPPRGKARSWERDDSSRLPDPTPGDASIT